MPSDARPIRKLPEHLINQIAAGEVIERPASVVKELIENSLDAGATRIEVELGDGGLEFISVSDDGGGIAEDDLAAALTRHCTSKLADAAELGAIATLGFRGEALASIAAVARVELLTRRAGAAHGWRLAVAPGRAPGAVEPAQATLGTRVTVRELFFEVPARKRFLKRGRTEFLHVQQALRRLAFACPSVAFRLSQAGSRALDLGAARGIAGDPRWRALFGQRFVQGAQPVEASVDGVRVSGWIGPPALATHQADLQLLALNGRPIRDRQLGHAVRLAYGDSLPPGRVPQYALALGVALDAVDVNVHPGKLEVRFAELRTVHDVLFTAVRAALDTALGTAAAPAPAQPGAALALGEPPRDYVAVTAATPALAPVASAYARHPLALVDDDLLLYHGATRLMLLDLRAAWRTVLARRLRTSAAPARRALLLPERLSAAHASALGPGLDALAALGFSIETLGPAGSVLRAVPAVLPELSASALLAALSPAELARDATAAVAAAAAQALMLGTQGRPHLALLDALARAAAAAGFEVESMARELDGAELRRLLRDAR